MDNSNRDRSVKTTRTEWNIHGIQDGNLMSSLLNDDQIASVEREEMISHSIWQQYLGQSSQVSGCDRHPPRRWKKRLPGTSHYRILIVLQFSGMTHTQKTQQ